MKTNGVPAIIMLAAGFIDCVIAILTHMSLWNFTRQLLLVLVLFYVIGCVVNMIIDRNFKDMEDDQKGHDGQKHHVVLVRVFLGAQLRALLYEKEAGRPRPLGS